MKEYMLYIRNAAGAKDALSAGVHLAFVKQCEVYIEKLKADGKLIDAQPLFRQGVLLTKINDTWNTLEIDVTNEVQVGYYHIRANNTEEIVEIAKENPEFEYVPSAGIEIHQIKTK